jgi:general secretion pathway protein G
MVTSQWLQPGRQRRAQQGFSLLELLIAMAIMALLVGMAVPVLRNSIKRQREAELRSALRTMRTAIDAFKRDAQQGTFSLLEADRFDPKTFYPKNLDYLVEGMKTQGLGDKTIRYLRRIPYDPMTKSTEWGFRSTEDAPDSDSWDGENIYDVYTKSNETALNGTRYKEW